MFRNKFKFLFQQNNNEDTKEMKNDYKEIYLNYFQTYIKLKEQSLKYFRFYSILKSVFKYYSTKSNDDILFYESLSWYLKPRYRSVSWNREKIKKRSSIIMYTCFGIEERDFLFKYISENYLTIDCSNRYSCKWYLLCRTSNLICISKLKFTCIYQPLVLTIFFR